MSVVRKWVRNLRKGCTIKNHELVVCKEPVSTSICGRSFLVSYPRSGSNYFQEILRSKYGMTAGSLYGDGVKHSNYENLKSHAISYEYLADECNLILDSDEKPNKIIVMFRDPRDVMISFFNFFKSYNQGEIKQFDFLSLDWFLVFTRNTNTRTWLRSTHQNPISIADSYQIFVNSWLVKKDTNWGALVTKLRYEDLVGQPEAIVDKTLAALNLDYDVVPKSKDDTPLVSTYSTEDRPRGRAQGWKCDDVYKEYKVLIDQVEKKLGDEINQLSY